MTDEDYVLYKQSGKHWMHDNMSLEKKHRLDFVVCSTNALVVHFIIKFQDMADDLALKRCLFVLSQTGYGGPTAVTGTADTAGQKEGKKDPHLLKVGRVA
jgi:hypothetical protein